MGCVSIPVTRSLVNLGIGHAARKHFSIDGPDCYETAVYENDIRSPSNGFYNHTGPTHVSYFFFNNLIITNIFYL